MIEADSVHSTPRTDSSSNNVIPLFGKKATRRSEQKVLTTRLDAAALVTFSAQAEEEPTPRERRRQERQMAPSLTETGKNQRLRKHRRKAWWRAGRATDYWRARLDWQAALELARQYNVADSASLQLPGNESRFDLVDKWREAVVKQLLTPAPDVAAVTWKRAQLAGRSFSHLPTKAECIEQVIADDVAFLAAHPTRRRRSR